MKFRGSKFMSITRKRLVVGTLALSAAVFSFALIFGLNYLLNSWTAFAGPAVVTGIFLVGISLGLPLTRRSMRKKIDILCYGKNYPLREELADFIEAIHSSIDLDQIAPPMLALVSKVFQLKQAALLLNVDGHYTSRCCERLLVDREDAVRKLCC